MDHKQGSSRPRMYNPSSRERREHYKHELAYCLQDGTVHYCLCSNSFSYFSYHMRSSVHHQRADSPHAPEKGCLECGYHVKALTATCDPLCLRGLYKFPDKYHCLWCLLPGLELLQVVPLFLLTNYLIIIIIIIIIIVISIIIIIIIIMELTHLSGFQWGPALNKWQTESNKSIILIAYRRNKN